MGSVKGSGGAVAQVGIVAGGTAIYSLCQWLILVLFARVTSAEELGEYSYALAVSAPFFIFFGLSLRQVYVSSSGEGYAWRDYLMLRIIASAGAFVVVLLFGLFSDSLTATYILVSLIKAVDLTAEIYLAPPQAVGTVRPLGVYQMINGGASLVLFAMGLSLGMLPVLALAMSFLGSLSAALYALHVGRFAIGARSDGFAWHARGASARRICSLALVSAPLGVAGCLNSAMQAAPRYVLERTTGMASVGIFSAMAYLLIAGNTVVSAVVQFELPRMVTLFHSGGMGTMNKRVRLLASRMAILGAAVVIGISLWGGRVVTLLYGSGYEDRPTLVFLGLSWAVGAVSWIWDMALVVHRAFVIQMAAALAGAVTAVVASALLVELNGLRGAGIAVLLATIAVALVRHGGLVFLARRSPEGAQ